MNTPPQKKRHKAQPTGGFLAAGVTQASGGIDDDATAIAVGKLVGAFTHLENFVGRLLAILAGMGEGSAGYVLRSVRNPRAKIDLMYALLEKSPRNKDRSEEWDYVIREFDRVNSGRNRYIHAEWWTGMDGSVWIAEWEEHGLGPLATRKIEADEIDKLRLDINALAVRIVRLASKEYDT